MPVDTLDANWDTPLGAMWEAMERGGPVDAVELSRELVEKLECVACGSQREVLQPLDAIADEDAVCDRCGADSVPHYLHAIPRGSAYMNRTPRQLGLPAWEIVWARRGDDFRGFEYGQ